MPDWLAANRQEYALLGVRATAELRTRLKLPLFGKSGTKTDAASESNANKVCKLPSGEEETRGKLL
ncbi:hypothetical protein [uncultured Rikenella sp.]|uniref:hypothetical protein n=1 Tax=uncultured Rikenella sp. TaxID=368003 RepID=UPI0025E814CE|nr:hypothetical protein [uncultured Rikenella sp.]